MSKTNIIPAGYRVTIVSWENDADNYSTVVLDGLEREYVNFLVKFANLFKSGKFGNMYEPHDSEISNLAKACVPLIKDSYLAIQARYSPDWSVDFDDKSEVTDVISEEMGTIHGCSEFYSRVTESVTVEYIPEEIRILDVTAEFV